MAFNPLAVTYANATPEQIALSGANVGTALGAYGNQVLGESGKNALQSIANERSAEVQRRKNKLHADVGSIMGALVGAGLAPVGAGFKGASLGASLGGAVAGRGQSASPLISGAMDLGSSIYEKKKLNDLLGQGN